MQWAHACARVQGRVCPRACMCPCLRIIGNSVQTVCFFRPGQKGLPGLQGVKGDQGDQGFPGSRGKNVPVLVAPYSHVGRTRTFFLV